MLVTAKQAREAFAAMPDDAVVHLCVTGLPYLPLTKIAHEPNGGAPNNGDGPGVAVVEVDQKRLANELGVDGPLRDLMLDIVANYDEEVIASICARKALAILDGVGAELEAAPTIAPERRPYKDLYDTILEAAQQSGHVTDAAMRMVRRLVDQIAADTIDEAKPSEHDMPGKYVQVEWDKDYLGGDYDDVGDFAYLELVDGLCDSNIQLRFEQQTKADRRNIIHYTFDELYVKDKDGEFVEWDGEDGEEGA